MTIEVSAQLVEWPANDLIEISLNWLNLWVSRPLQKGSLCFVTCFQCPGKQLKILPYPSFSARSEPQSEPMWDYGIFRSFCEHMHMSVAFYIPKTMSELFKLLIYIYLIFWFFFLSFWPASFWPQLVLPPQAASLLNSIPHLHKYAHVSTPPQCFSSIKFFISFH